MQNPRNVRATYSPWVALMGWVPTGWASPAATGRSWSSPAGISRTRELVDGIITAVNKRAGATSPSTDLDARTLGLLRGGPMPPHAHPQRLPHLQPRREVRTPHHAPDRVAPGDLASC